MKNMISVEELKPEEYTDIIFITKDGKEYNGCMDHLGRFLSETGGQVTEVVAWKKKGEEDA